ncbi:FecR family protein [Chitinophaga sp.]|uniref:FecR family protein n=1 Tax=Chitinophaga sp. TaxID=1869181 RepID=UPI0031D1FED1
MENTINDELLTRYLANEAPASEQALVERWLALSEENRQYLDTLRQAWQLADARQTLDYVLDEMNMDEKWAQFRQSGAKQVSSKKPIAMLAAAAAIGLLVIASWQWLYKRPHTHIAAVNTAQSVPHDSLHHEVNTTGKEKKLTMADGTSILLADQSALTWREPFTDNRAVSISGKAFFQVASDHQHPFTVISGDISTTVLGTGFEVNTFHDITVRLYTGKVMITSSNTRRMKNKVYLSPGQEFIYGNQIIVRSFLQNVSSVTGDKHPAEDPYIASGEENNWYMFNNQSLEEVLNQLEALYKVKIIYNSADIKNIYFTARYERTESLASILQRIAKLNNLKITDNDSVMIIKK